MMSKVRWAKVARDFGKYKSRNALVVLAIAVGVATFGMVLQGREIAMEDMYAGYWSNNPPHIRLYTETFDQDLATMLGSIPEIEDVESRRVINTRLQVGEDEWVDLELTVLADYENSRISVVRPESGDWPPEKQEVLLERSSLVLTDADVGDMLTVKMPSGEQVQLRMASFAHEFNDFSSYISRQARGFITMDTIEWLGLAPGFNQLYMTITDDQQDMSQRDQVRQLVSMRLDELGYRVLSHDSFLTRPAKHWADDFFSALMLIMGAVGALSLLLSGFLVMNTVMAILSQETRQIGVMKAVGAQRGQVLGIYLASIAVYGGIALLVSVPLSQVGGMWFANFGSGVMNYDIDFRFVPWVFALQVAMAIGIPALTALVPIYIGTRKTVHQAVTDYGISDVRPGIMDRILSRVRGLPRPMALSLRNTFRRRMRLALTLMALSLAGAIMIGVFCTRESMTGVFNGMLELYNYDVQISFAEPVPVELVESETDAVDGVARVESWVVSVPNRVRDDGSMGSAIGLFGPPSDQQTVKAMLLEGRWLLPDDENAIVISQGYTQVESDLVVGDELTLVFNGKESSWRVVGIYLATDQGGYVNRPALARAADMESLASMAAVVIDQRNDPSAQESVARKLEERYQLAGLPVLSTSTIEDVRESNANQINLVVYLLLVIAALLAIVGGLGLAATMGLNVMERWREVGILRSIGASNWAVWRIIVAEGVLIGLISWALGALLSLPVGSLLTQGLAMAFMGSGIDFIFAPIGIAIWLAVSIIVSAAASFVPARKASRISVREALAYE
jgi:putative ABC transport system permease protein